MIFERMISRLLPTGRAWLQRENKVMTAILGGLADQLDDLRAQALLSKDSILPQEMDAQFIPDWEKRFGLPVADLTEQERRDRLDAQWQPGRITNEYLQVQLQAAGFDVYVIEYVFLAEANSLGDLILGDAILEGNIVEGQVVNQCTSGDRPDSILGELILDEDSHMGAPLFADPCKNQAGDGLSLGDFVLGDGVPLESNRAKYIFNYIDPLFDPTNTCEMIEQLCARIFFIQGPGDFGDAADVPADRYLEFRELVLRHKRAASGAACFLNLV